MADQDHPCRTLFYAAAATALCACSGNSYSFSPSDDPPFSTGSDTTGGVGAGGEAGTADNLGAAGELVSGGNAGRTTDGTPSPPAKDSGPPDGRVMDIGVGTVRDSGSIDATSDRSTPPDASNSIPPTGLLLWLSADVDVSVQSGHVAGWRDRSGSGNDAKQMVEAVRPSLESSWHNGRPALAFDGVSQYLALPSSFNDFNSGISIFVVGDAGNGSSCPSFVHFSNGLENDDLSLHLEHNNDFSYEVAFESIKSPADTAPTNRPLLLTAVQWPNQDTRLFGNGTPSGQKTMMLPAQVHRVENDIGRSSYVGCGLLAGHIAEIILYRRALEAPERTAVEAYLRTKWNI